MNEWTTGFLTTIPGPRTLCDCKNSGFVHQFTMTREEKKAYDATYYAAHVEARKAYKASYYAGHVEEIKAYNAAYRVANAEKIQAYNAAHVEEIKAYRVFNAGELKEYDAAYRASGKALANARMRKYGLSPEAFQLIRLEQKNACGICAETFSKEPHVDHCHATGEVRGLLCGRCNKALGLLKDSPSAFRRAAEYLESVGKQKQTKTRK